MKMDKVLMLSIQLLNNKIIIIKNINANKIFRELLFKGRNLKLHLKIKLLVFIKKYI